MVNTGNAELNYCYHCMRHLAAGQTVCPACGHDNRGNLNPPNTLPEGTILAGKYLLGKVLGQGGFGITYLGIDLILKKRIAVKEYYPRGLCTRMPGSNRVTGIDSLSHPEDFRSGLEEFGKEAQTLAQISSPNIVRVLNAFRENGTAYIVMEYVEGISLSKEVRDRGGRLSWQRVSDLFRDLIPELEKLHEKHLIHRDIKPDNLMISRGENGKEKLVLLDFGTARRFESAEVSQTYTAMLTHGYAPLEQYSPKGKQGPYTDIYALCATMYAVLTGEVPPSASERSMGDAHLRSISEQGLKVPERMEKALLHGLEVRREDRPQRMGDLYAELYGDEQKYIPDDPKELIYQAGLKLMAADTPEGYQQALTLFQQVPGWKNAGAMAEVCRKKIQGGAPTVKENKRNPKPGLKKWLFIPLLAVLLAAGFFLWCGIRQQHSNSTGIQTAAGETLTLTPTNTPEPTSMPANGMVSAGDIITFGRYEQDGNTVNGPEAIEWQVLEVEDGRALLISRYGLDAKPYNEKYENVTWETCTLRAWLNGEFFNRAFSSEEKGQIQQVTLKNPDNAKYGTMGGNDTTDRIFLLSIEEVNRYFANDEARKCLPTTYAKNNGVFVYEKTGTVWWWLRSPGNSVNNAAAVNTSGIVDAYGNDGNNTGTAARPAFWLDLDENAEIIVSTETSTPIPTETPTLTHTAEPTAMPTKKPLRPGDVILLGQYEQDGNRNSGLEEIEWQVLTVEDGRALVISRYGLDAKPYNEEDESVTWETCTLRKWLNGEFYNSAFSSAEKGQIQEVRLKNPDNTSYGTKGGNDTTDRIFLLSIDEANQYFANDEARKCWPTRYAKSNMAYVSTRYGGTTWWRLRSPGYDDSAAAAVNSDGNVDSYGHSVQFLPGSMRPAFWLDLGEMTNYSEKLVVTETPMPSNTPIPDNEESTDSSQTIETATRGFWVVSDTLLRDSPSNSGTVFRSILAGTDFTYTGASKEADGKTWIHIKTENGNEGWIDRTAARSKKYDSLPQKAGEFITMGRYEQDNDLNNGPEAIEWKVLAVEDDWALVISEYGLDAKPYDEEWKGVTWETCSLRNWLNVEFYNSAFTSAEKGRIREVRLKNPDNAEYGTKGGNDTTDRIFLLSIDDVEQYFADDEARKCWVTEYATNRGARVHDKIGTSMWWLRLPGISATCAVVVEHNGNINGLLVYIGDGVGDDGVVARPAFWLKL